MEKIETGHVKSVKYLNEGADVPTVYANNVDMSVSTWDVRLRFGQIQGVSEGDVSVKNVVTVYMSVDHARLFIDTFSKQLEKWDALNAKAKD